MLPISGWSDMGHSKNPPNADVPQPQFKSEEHAFLFFESRRQATALRQLRTSILPLYALPPGPDGPPHPRPPPPDPNPARFVETGKERLQPAPIPAAPVSRREREAPAVSTPGTSAAPAIAGTADATTTTGARAVSGPWGSTAFPAAAAAGGTGGPTTTATAPLGTRSEAQGTSAADILPEAYVSADVAELEDVTKMLRLTRLGEEAGMGGPVVGPTFRPGWHEGRKVAFLNHNSRVYNPEWLLHLEEYWLMSWTEEEEKTFLDVWGHNQKVTGGD